ncbi:amidohydrolase family protein [Microbacterium sp. NPDC087591]|uniref:amidohydrolase family protein n=1 Tax=Microbacterium sp. NPDC087591 TaxID=3364192 RepID=UPI003803C6D2
MSIPTFTAGVPAIDHHSHAGYVRPGERLEGIDALQRENAMGHLEANLPVEVFDAFITARAAGDAGELARLEADHGIQALFDESSIFQSTSVYGVSLAEGTRALYGELDHAEAVRVSAQQREDDFPGLYDRALEVSETALVLTDIPAIDAQSWSPERYKPIGRIDPYLYPFGHPVFRRRGSDTPRFRRVFGSILRDLLDAEGLDEPPTTLGAYLDFVRGSIIRRQESGFVGLKIASAYVRSLDFTRRSREEAEAAYALLRQDPGAVETPAYAALADYLIFAIAEMAVERELPVQIHTGMGHAEPGLLLSGADPRLLEPLLSDRALNRLRVILIHGGYPYTSHLAALSQAHGNVFVDFSWMPYLHHHALERMLQEWLELLPADKVMFGTDTGQPEFHVASVARGRLLLDRALASGVADRLWTTTQAEWLARRVLNENLTRVYGLEAL